MRALYLIITLFCFCWTRVVSGRLLQPSAAFLSLSGGYGGLSSAASAATPTSLASPAAAAAEPAAAAAAAADQRGKTRCYGYPLTYGASSSAADSNSVALVTGASRGIGLAVAKALATGGVKTILCVARDQAACDAAAAELRGLGVESEGFAVDVGEGLEVSALCTSLLDKFTKIDILINNAGITKDNLFLRMQEADCRQVIDVNLNSAFYFTQPIIKQMAKQRYGRILNMSSVVGVGGNAGQANYAASKAGLIGLTKSLSKEYANRGVTVNAIAPGFIKSPMTDKMPEAAKAAALASIPAGRLGTPEEVAHLAAFLASDQAAYITGKVFPIDGGMLFGSN